MHTAPQLEADATEPMLAALRQVIDPELGLDIVSLGLIYRLELTPAGVEVDLTTTSPACPMGNAIADDVEDVLRDQLPQAQTITINRVSEPPWSPARMSERARRALGWD